MTKKPISVVTILFIGVIFAGAILLMGSTGTEAAEKDGPRVCTDMAWECNIQVDGDVECHEVPGSGCRSQV